MPKAAQLPAEPPHVLVFPSWYPSAYRPSEGIFIREQLRHLSSQARLGVIYPELRSLKSLRLAELKKRHFQASYTLESGLPTYRRHGWNVPFSRLQAELYVRPALELLRPYLKAQGVPDLIHAHACFWGALAAARAAERCERPFVVTVHWNGFIDNELDGFQRKVAAQVLPQAERVVCVSAALATSLKPYTGDNLEVIPNPIDTAFFTLPPARDEAGPFRIVSVANLVAVKRLDALIRAFASAFPAGSEELCIGGEGPERPRLETLITDLNLKSRVKLLGALDKSGVRDLLWRADLFVSASQTETFGMALAEALAAGVPVVATRSGGPEVIVQPDCGLLTGHSVDALSGALLEARARPFAPPAELRRSVDMRYSASVIAKRLLSLYDQVRR